MDPTVTRRMILGCGGIAALVVGWQIAQGRVVLALALAGGICLLLLNRALKVTVDAWIMGLVILGYLVGNRGFAQISVPGLPLFPAEVALGLGVTFLVWRSARTRTFPVQRDALHFSVLAWIAIGAVRLPFDFKVHHFMAVRDFAIIYYALFFFLVQAWCEDPEAKQWLRRCLIAGLVLAAPVFWAFNLWPEFFTEKLVLGEIPLIYVKGDVAGGFMAAAALWCAQRYTQSKRIWWLVFAGGGLVGVALSNSRAALAGFMVGVVWLIIAHCWSTLRTIVGLSGAGLLALVALAAFSPAPVQQSRLYRIYESFASMVDVHGERAYRSDELSDKPDNNRFRLIWWKVAIAETLETSPWIGQGFGYDLADTFVRTYYSGTNDQFAVRSPHNFVVTVLSRMGAIGGCALAILIGAMALKTFGAGREANANPNFGAWLTVWVVFTTACFGVVLEGPMGAVVFWSALGLADHDKPGENPQTANVIKQMKSSAPASARPLSLG